MNHMESDFFDAYKHLDKLCREILNSQSGISEYITQMEQNVNGGKLVAHWRTDYQTLKHLRWVRNQIAHETGGTYVVTKDDLEAVEAFYERIMAQDDPFARLRKVDQSAEKYMDNNSRTWQQMNRKKNSTPPEKDVNLVPLFFLLGGIVLALIFLASQM